MLVVTINDDGTLASVVSEADGATKDVTADWQMVEETHQTSEGRIIAGFLVGQDVTDQIKEQLGTASCEATIGSGSTIVPTRDYIGGAA